MTYIGVPQETLEQAEARYGIPRKSTSDTDELLFHLGRKTMDDPLLIGMNKLPAFDVSLYRAAICAIVSSHKGRNPRMLGSILSAEGKGLNQLTLLVDRTPQMRLLDLGNMYQELSALLNVTIDIWTPEELPAWLKEDVLAECIPLSNDQATP